ncbi:MAG: type II toxin-antitoxin system RelE/ParE family toxin [Blautia sp.]|nr:type II toxin-antitoxin system RelE/ParE family toxin [Blautia sp.]
MKYDIHITRSAEKDLNSAADYIEFVLLNPQAADNLLDEAESRIGDLSAFPEKFALVDDPVLKAWGIRFTLVKNYIAFYVISEENHTVYIVRFLYGKRDWITILKQGFSLE